MSRPGIRAYERHPDQVRDHIQEDIELWRRIPWLVMLYHCGPVDEPYSWHAARRRAVFGGVEMADAHQGLYPVSQASRNDVIDCRTGELLANRYGGKRRVLGDREVERLEADDHSTLRPHSLLALETELLNVADSNTVKLTILTSRITPRWHALGEPLDGPDAMLMMLCSDWTGSIVALLDASGLLVS